MRPGQALQLPLQVRGRKDGTTYGEVIIADATGDSLLTTDGYFFDPDAAQLLVEATNNYEELVNLLRAFIAHGGCEWDSKWDMPDEEGRAIASKAGALLRKLGFQTP